MSELKAIADGVWSIDDSISPSAGFRMPVRATLLRLASGDLVLHSPLAIDDDLAKQIAALGPVKTIVASNCMHWTFVGAARMRYPDARLLGAPGLEAKLGLPFDPLPESGSVLDELRVQRVAGALKMNEHVFLHEPSRSLVVSDLVFNVHGGANLPMSIVLWLNGAYRKAAQSRVWRFVVKDRSAAAQSAEAILDWDFDRVVVAHGDVIEGEARTRLRAALSWMTKPAKAPAALREAAPGTSPSG